MSEMPKEIFAVYYDGLNLAEADVTGGGTSYTRTDELTRLRAIEQAAKGMRDVLKDCVEELREPSGDFDNLDGCIVNGDAALAEYDRISKPADVKEE